MPPAPDPREELSPSIDGSSFYRFCAMAVRHDPNEQWLADLRGENGAAFPLECSLESHAQNRMLPEHQLQMDDDAIVLLMIPSFLSTEAEFLWQSRSDLEFAPASVKWSRPVLDRGHQPSVENRSRFDTTMRRPYPIASLVAAPAGVGTGRS